MHWLKSDRWKAGIAIAGILLLLIPMVWVPVSAVGAQERASGLATPVTGTAQTTPTADPTMIALQKEQLTLQNDKLKSDNSWAWLSSVSTIFGPLATIGTILAGILVARNNFLQWSKNREDEQRRREDDQRIEQEKRDEDRFQKVVEGLGDQNEGAKIGAATVLRTFLRPGYERYYTQVFDLAVANLRLPRISKPPEDSDTPQQLTPLSRALIVLFKEAFPRARSEDKGWSESLKRTHIQTRFKLTGIQSLDASGIQLDYANLAEADLSQVWMCQASLRKTDLTGANLSGAYLWKTNLSEAYLWETDLSGANLLEANLSGADLSGANIQDALSLEDTDLRGVKGLDDKQKEDCRAKGAINVPASSALPAQGNTPPSGTGGSSAASSKPGPGGVKEAP